MRILLDECLPKRLKRDLVGYEAKSVPEMGWAGKTNGTLLALAQVDFDVFLTVDRNLSFQQDVNKFGIAVVVLVAKSNKHSALRKAEPELDQRNEYCHSSSMTQAAKRAIDTIEALAPAERQEVLAELLRRAAQSNHDLPTDDDLIGLADQVFLDLEKHEAGQ